MTVKFLQVKQKYVVIFSCFSPFEKVKKYTRNANTRLNPVYKESNNANIIHHVT